MNIKRIILFFILPAVILLNHVNACFAEDKTLTLPDYAQLYNPNDFPVKPYESLTHKAPSLADPLARYFRTRLREAAKESPDFAGNMVVASWGCGSGCIRFAFVNVETGDVWFPDFDMFYPTDTSVIESAELYHWKNSNLFVAIGSKEGWSDTPGVYYYKWTGKELKLLKFVKQ